MPCTTILVGKKASYDGSTLMARNMDGGHGHYLPVRFKVMNPEDQPRHYKSVIRGCEIELPDNPMRYTSMPLIPEYNKKMGIWGEAGINEANVAMTATETITSNARVLGCDPLVKTGIGEEDIVTITLPYIHTAREGAQRLGALIEQYGTDETNGIGFQDVDEIWWFESVGGHHWMAKRVPDDAYVVGPNQLGIDSFDMIDAFGEQKNHMCSADLVDFIIDNHLDLTMNPSDIATCRNFDTRSAFGSHSDQDHIYNTPRAWAMGRYFNPTTIKWDGEDAQYKPASDNIPWSFVPEKKITVEDVKYIMSYHYQGTKYDAFLHHGPEDSKGQFRPIGINRTSFVSITQIRPYIAKEMQAIEWIALGCTTFNEAIPVYTNITKAPAYYTSNDTEVTTNTLYWSDRLIAALADSCYYNSNAIVERYQNQVAALGHQMVNKFDKEYAANGAENIIEYLEKCNQEISDAVQKETTKLLGQVLDEATNNMVNSFARDDA